MTVIPFKTSEEPLTVENDKGLIALMVRTRDEVFGGSDEDFEEAYAQALKQQVFELSQASASFTPDSSEELADAMRGVLIQWLGEHPSCPREDMEYIYPALGLNI